MTPPPNPRLLQGKVILVTGASRGIGNAIAHTLAAAGADVAVASRTLHLSEALAKELKKRYRVRPLPIELDVTKPPSVENMAEKLLKHYMRIDAVINNAGVMLMDQLLQGDIDVFTETIGTNVGGPFLVTRALIEEMMLVKRGHIINIAAVAGLSGAPYLAAYCASKAALISLTQSWAEELAEYHVKVHALCPDVVDTESLRDLLDTQKVATLSPQQVADKVLDLLISGGPESGAAIPLEAVDATEEVAHEI